MARTDGVPGRVSSARRRIVAGLALRAVTGPVAASLVSRLMAPRSMLPRLMLPRSMAPALSAGASTATLAAVARPAVAAAGAAKRIISVGGDVTEIVFALGQGDRVIAVDDTSLWPEAVATRPKVGYLRSLAPEGLLSLRPDLLLVGSGAGPESTLRQVSSAGVAVTRVPEGYSLDIIRQKISGIIEALDIGAEPAGADLLAAFDRQCSELEQALPALRRQAEPRTTLLLVAGGTGSPQAAGRKTAGNAIIDLVGAKNVFSHPGYKAVSLEALAAAAPEVILVLDPVSTGDAVAELAGNPLVKLTPAGQAGRIFSVGSAGLLGFGPRTPQFALELARRLRQPARG